MENTSKHIYDKEFVLYLKSKEIQDRISCISSQINLKSGDNNDIVFVSILNGSFMFTSDLCKEVNFDPYVSFLKVTSYDGLHSTGKINNVIGLDCDVAGKTVFIIEDIIDSGNTIEFLYNHFKELRAKDIFVVCLLLKPEAYKKSIPIDFIGFEIPNDFVVGYGMDYNGLGRNLKEIYVLK